MPESLFGILMYFYYMLKNIQMNYLQYLQYMQTQYVHKTKRASLYSSKTQDNHIHTTTERSSAQRELIIPYHIYKQPAY